MKVLLLSLVLGLVCVQEPQLEPAQISGNWNTIYIAANDAEKISETGSLRGYIRNTECTEDCGTLAIKFYNKATGTCQEHSAVGERTENNVYTTDCEHTAFSDARTFSNRGPRLGPATTRSSKGYSLSEEEYQTYEKLTEEWGIPRDNIENIILTGKVPDHNMYPKGKPTTSIPNSSFLFTQSSLP
uniref:Lipocalin/cytosolic fatty-acid binding domain-containing protein n=1 Tax=Catagonus wagneri TaxID=51154 RepID=A0A8C3YDJ3_9CETA